MKVGLYLDVAVGVQSDGFDAWNEQAAISRHLGVGAPPDPLNTAGQDWGLAGFNAAGLEIQLVRAVREMLQASMRHAGAIRLDHVLGLKRLYLVPRGFGRRDGAYVQMPFEALLAVTAQESVAHRCVVIGEDLGTVPEGFREQMADWGIWSYLVMMFERDDHGAFSGIDHYPANALVTFNTHDLSTYAGWRSFSDLKLKRSLGIDPGESDDARWHALAMLTMCCAITASTVTISMRWRVSWRGPGPGCWRSRWRICWAWSTSPTFPAPSTSIRTGGSGCRWRSSISLPRSTSRRSRARRRAVVSGELMRDR